MPNHTWNDAKLKGLSDRLDETDDAATWNEWVARASPYIKRAYPDDVGEFSQRCQLPHARGGVAVVHDPFDGGLQRAQADLARQAGAHYRKAVLAKRRELRAFLEGLDLAHAANEEPQ